MRVLAKFVVLAILCFLGVKSENLRLYATGTQFTDSTAVIYDGLTEVALNAEDMTISVRSLLAGIPQGIKGYLFEGNCAGAHADVSRGYNSSEFSFDVEFDADFNALIGTAEGLSFDNETLQLNTLLIETEGGNFCSDLTSKLDDGLFFKNEVIYEKLGIAIYGTEYNENLTALAYYADVNATGIATVSALVYPSVTCDILSNETLDSFNASLDFTLKSSKSNGVFITIADFSGEYLDFEGDLSLLIADDAKNVLLCELISSETGELPTEEPVRTTEAPSPRGELPTETISSSFAIVPSIAAVLVALLAL